MRQWRPWTLLPSAVPNTKTDHRLPGSSRRPKMATAYTGWLGLTLGPGLWQRNGTVAKRCLGLTLSRNRTLFTRKYPWQVGKSCRTKWHRRYGHYTLPRRGLRDNQLTENPQSPYLCGFNMLQREDRPVGGKSIENTGLFEHRGKTQEGNVSENIVWEFLRCCAAASLFDFYSHCIIV